MPARSDARSCFWAAAVVSAYRPGDSLVAAVASIAPQVDKLVVVDDGSPDAGEPAMADLYDRCRSLGAEIVLGGANRGIGAALNRGIVRVLDGAPADGLVITFDQDSIAPAGYVDGLLDAYHGAVAEGVPVGMIGPSGVSGVRAVAAGTCGGVVRSKEPIQSGLGIPVRTFAACGGFDAGLFIDGVDTEFYLRATQSGRWALAAPGVHLEHRLGNPHRVRVLGRRVELVVANDFRYYYQLRNLVELLRRYGRRDASWAIGAIAKAVRHQTITGILVPGRLRRWAFCLRGLRDGLRGVTGRMPDRSGR